MFGSLRRWPAAFRTPRFSQAGSPRQSRRRPARRCLPLEQLEGRLVLSAYHVSTLADGGAGSLRDAVARANAHAGADVIVFDDGLTGTIALTGGQLDLTDDVKINGPGADKLTVSGGNASRVFKVEAGETVEISGVTLAGGNAVRGNGGGIDNFGALTVSDSVFSGNVATIGGGGLTNEGGATATVRDSTFTGNSAAAAGGGLLNLGGTATVSDSTFTGNATTGNASRGGGIFNGGQGTLTVSDSTLTGNAATFGGGVFSVGTATVSDTTFTTNSALTGGGGLENIGTATVSGSTFTGNTAGSGNGGLNNEPGGVLTQFDNRFLDDLPPDVFP